MIELLAALLWLLLPLDTHAALSGILEPNLEPAIPFYKAPESPFPSGQARKSSLEKSQMGSFTNFHYKAKWGEKTLYVKNEHILRELDVTFKARARKNTQVLLFPELTSSQVTTITPKQTVEIESIRGIWARVHVSSLHKGYVLLTDLETPQEDLGVWTSLTDINLKKEPFVNSKTIATVPALDRLQLLRHHGDYAFVKTKSKAGYVSFKDLIGRVDFATFGWNQKKKKWDTISYRNGAQIIISPTESYPLSDYSAFYSSKNKALIAGAHPVASRGARVELIEPQAVKWFQSLVKGHGSVWWKMNLIEKGKPENTITTDELLKKSLKGISFDSKAKKGLASAKGVYKTLDGKKWTKIPFFGQEDWPVSLHPDGVWFVGPYRSTNEGESFQPSVKWSDLVQNLQKPKGKGKTFMHFRVLDVKNLPNSQVMLKVDTGITIVKIRAHILGNHWTPM